MVSEKKKCKKKLGNITHPDNPLVGINIRHVGDDVRERAARTDLRTVANHLQTKQRNDVSNVLLL